MKKELSEIEKYFESVPTCPVKQDSTQSLLNSFSVKKESIIVTLVSQVIDDDYQDKDMMLDCNQKNSLKMKMNNSNENSLPNSINVLKKEKTKSTVIEYDTICEYHFLLTAIIEIIKTNYTIFYDRMKI